VLSDEEIEAGRVPILAPAGFTEHAISENVYAGTAMARRAGYMYGAALDRGPRGQVGAGLGQTVSTGALGLVPPTVAITATGQEETVDGIRMVFQMAPGTEAPAEMHVYFSERGALCIAENATHNLHNVLTLRGAVVRDPHALAGVPDRGHRPVRRRPRGGLRLPPLADLGAGARCGVPRPAA
jgi:alkyl sulfatase BDS1-like metallo-beta-lactamase superfamily hydrolase